MIRVDLMPEPPSFDENVRKPGENALAWLAGKPLPHKLRDQPRAPHTNEQAQVGEHAVARQSTNETLAYEWKNFRLACGYANTCKNQSNDVLDPAAIENGWFQLDLLTLRVHPNPELDVELRDKIDATIKRLKLCEARAHAARKRALDRFRAGLDLAFLHKDHPFLAKELVRQGITSREKLPTLPSEIKDAKEEELLLSS